jgi:hypothetical protein
MQMCSSPPILFIHSPFDHHFNCGHWVQLDYSFDDLFFGSDEVKSSFSGVRRGMELSRRQQFVYGVFYGEEISWLFDDYIYGRTIIWRIAGTHQHGRGRGSHFDDVRHFSARHARHGIVGQDQIVKGGIETVKRLAGGICTIHLISKIIEKQLRQQTDINIIIN